MELLHKSSGTTLWPPTLSGNNDVAFNQSINQSINDSIILACAHSLVATPLTSDLPDVPPSCVVWCYSPAKSVPCVSSEFTDKWEPVCDVNPPWPSKNA